MEIYYYYEIADAKLKDYESKYLSSSGTYPAAWRIEIAGDSQRIWCEGMNNKLQYVKNKVHKKFRPYDVDLEEFAWVKLRCKDIS
jgi:hypothetical protein